MPFDPLTCMFTCDTFVGNVINQINHGGPVMMKATPADAGFYRCEDKKGNNIPLYELTASNDPTTAFWAYWCPYDANRTAFTTLTGHAEWMFTATMDGCTFGVGRAAPDGTVVVGHANANRHQTKKSISRMAQTQRAELQAELGMHASMLQPKNYRFRGTFSKKRDVSSATFGVRDGSTWKFYAHLYRKQVNMTTGSVTYTYRETKQIG
ncbi:MAG TPA: hypothetical protein VGM87_15380 [Roseomonas sp.]